MRWRSQPGRNIACHQHESTFPLLTRMLTSMAKMLPLVMLLCWRGIIRMIWEFQNVCSWPVVLRTQSSIGLLMFMCAAQE